MRDFKRSYRQDSRRDSRGSSRGSGRNSGGYGRRDDSDRFSRPQSGGFRRGRREEKMMHRVVCDGCGKDCEVPFKPTDSKPVYCNECFGNKKNISDNPSNRDIDIINEKLNKIMKLNLRNKSRQMILESKARMFSFDSTKGLLYTNLVASGNIDLMYFTL